MLLEVAGLSIDLATPAGPLRIVDELSFALADGESLGVVGESGSGKTMIALALMGLTPDGSKVEGSIRFAGEELVGLDDAALRKLRGDRLAIVFQEPMTALNPLHRVGAQVAEPLVLHRAMSKSRAAEEAKRLLARVALREPERIANSHPFALSGGERQRAMIAMAIACGPKLIIADEPTTALDVTVQAQILALLDGLREEAGMAMLLISHDLAVISGHCDRVVVVYAGAIMESGPAEAVLRSPAHPYTQALIAARPQPGAKPGAPLKTIPGAPPDLTNERVGCPFAERCPLVVAICRSAPPPVVAIAPNREARCFRVEGAERAPAERAP